MLRPALALLLAVSLIMETQASASATLGYQGRLADAGGRLLYLGQIADAVSRLDQHCSCSRSTRGDTSC